MLKTTGLSVASDFRVDDDEVVGGGGAGAASCGSECQRAHQTIQVTKKYSHAFQPEVGWTPLVVHLKTQ